MTHLVMEEAIRRDRKVGLLFIDLEAQYQYTIQHVKEIYELYKEHIIPFWCSVPLVLSNAVSAYEPRWICWEPNKEWVRQPDVLSITDFSQFPFYEYAMEFEEFTPLFGKWFAQKKSTACFVGIRSDESLNRYRTIKNQNKSMYKKVQWSTLVDDNLYNFYPVYDWKTADIWRYNGKFFKPYNKIYDLMHKAGISIHQARLCQPYGADQRKGLWLFQVLESETWSKIVARVNGANSGAEFVQYSGNVSGQIKISKPAGHTWQSFAELILKSLPNDLADHYDDKICQFLSWWDLKGGYYDLEGNFYGIYNGIPDEIDAKIEAKRQGPSWRRICKTLLRNDYWCKGLSFSQTNSHSYKRYKEMMKKRKKKRGYIQLWI
jgi:predicted phosphoadenosine phosphosulfate sulfurtransferase